MCFSYAAKANLFGYQGNEQAGLSMFPQWIAVLERSVKQSRDINCKENIKDQCRVKQWLDFLHSIRQLPQSKQIKKVNSYANAHPYILDINNYNVDDYWAAPREFLYNHGDCEDYAITKMLSLKILGFNMQAIRLVVLQDTNLKVAHAVLAIKMKSGDVLIMDNQIDEVISHKHILHYVPIYALDEKKWWLFLPQ